MSEDFAFSLHRRGTHAMAGRTVLQLVPGLDSVEVDRAPVDVAKALAEVGARALVAAPPGPLVSELQACGGLWLDFPTRTKNPLSMALAVRRLRRLVADERVDLVHARSRPGAWVALAAVRASKTPLVTSLNQIAPGRSAVRHHYDSVMVNGDLVIAGSSYAAATIASVYPAAADRIVLVRPGVDLKPFTARDITPARVQALRQAWQVAPEERIILLAARPSIWKGHKVLIDATRLLLDMGARDLRLVFIGDAKGSGGREIDQAVKASGLGGLVRKIAHCADMPAALLAAAVRRRAVDRARVVRPRLRRGAGGRHPGRRVRPWRGAGDGAGTAGDRVGAAHRLARLAERSGPARGCDRRGAGAGRQRPRLAGAACPQAGRGALLDRAHGQGNTRRLCRAARAPSRVGMSHRACHRRSAQGGTAMAFVDFMSA